MVAPNYLVNIKRHYDDHFCRLHLILRTLSCTRAVVVWDMKTELHLHYTAPQVNLFTVNFQHGRYVVSMLHGTEKLKE